MTETGLRSSSDTCSLQPDTVEPPALEPQARAADPGASVFVSANAGSGKTSTLVSRVARLLLRGTAPEAVLCVTYTKAAAAEMQRRLFDTLGDWSVMDDAELRRALAGIDESTGNVSHARTLFARALETPGGLKIQTLHAFCEKLLRRFPLEAGVSPGFSVLEDAAAAEVSSRARDAVAMAALDDPEGPIGRAYAGMAVELDYRAFEALFATLEAQRQAIASYRAACAERGEDVTTDVWRTCGFESPVDPDAVEAEALDGCDWARWRSAAEALLATGAPTDAEFAAKLTAVAGRAVRPPFSECFAVFTTRAGELTKRPATKGLEPSVRDWLLEERERLHRACRLATAARMAQHTIAALTLAAAYGALYEGEKTARGAMDFADLIDRTRLLLTEKADSAWVLYKLDGGIDHVLVDEAQDTAPEQWDILRALTGEFFAGESRLCPPNAGRTGQSPVSTRPPLERTVFVVGDEKQSIYGFQGARPERLAQETRYYASQVRGAGRRFETVPLLKSWRSAPEILTFVDQVFADASTRAAAPPPAGEDHVRHVAGRSRAAGSVDVWPLFQDQPQEEPGAWDAPVDTPAVESGRKRLSRRIAAEVAALIAGGEGVAAKGDNQLRPATAGDVLILVRRRDALFEDIIRELKKSGVPVAGADRLKLSEHIAFQDLLGLARFALYPADDLTLAEILRSPFCDVDEQGLYDLAQPRGKGRSLWAELTTRGDERAEWGEARMLLGWARKQAAEGSPFDFFARLLGRLDGAGRSMKRRLLTRLGREAEDALDEFLAQALAAESRGLHDLESFVAAMERSDVEVKRELEGPRGEVRVMTVHGAKGLEAPIVILPDSTTKPPPIRGGLLPTPAGGYLFAPRKADDCEASAAARQALADQSEAESLRLLYVAMTRARDRLIICGRIAAKQKGAAEGSWYRRVVACLRSPEVAPHVREIVAGPWITSRFGADPPLAPAERVLSPYPVPLPPWTRGLAPTEPAADIYASPSTAAEQHRGPAPSPLSAYAQSGAGLGRFRRGDLIHGLLQALPDLEPARRRAAALRLLDKERDLSPDQRSEMADAALGVLDDAAFAVVFGPGSRAEAAVAGSAPDLPAGLKISGRVDRMVVTADRVLVVDFKTNRPSPDRVEDADPAYLTQMALYVAVLRAVFPERRVEAALVWTDGPKLMHVPEKLMASSLAALPGAT